MLSEGWRDQYERMLRAHDQLSEVSAGTSSGSALARDALYHFFQDAYHLKDWLENDPKLHKGDAKARREFNAEVEKLVKAAPLRLCGHLANGTKHLVGKPTAFVSQSPTVHVGGSVAHSWSIKSKQRKGRDLDALELAGIVIKAWEAWLGADTIYRRTKWRPMAR